jgi:hypothetical protein
MSSQVSETISPPDKTRLWGGPDLGYPMLWGLEEMWATRRRRDRQGQCLPTLEAKGQLCGPILLQFWRARKVGEGPDPSCERLRRESIHATLTWLRDDYLSVSQRLYRII